MWLGCQWYPWEQDAAGRPPRMPWPRGLHAIGLQFQPCCQPQQRLVGPGAAPHPGEEELCFPVPEQVLPGGAAASCKLIMRQAEKEVCLHRCLSAGRWHSRRLIRHPASL